VAQEQTVERHRPLLNAACVRPDPPADAAEVLIDVERAMIDLLRIERDAAP
jgi:hypothetical protein